LLTPRPGNPLLWGGAEDAADDHGKLIQMIFIAEIEFVFGHKEFAKAKPGKIDGPGFTFNRNSRFP
jgi:hypothetical protein